MNYEENSEEKRIRDLSERENPYAKECPNRHLWSEGFRNGYITAYNKTPALLKFAEMMAKHELGCAPSVGYMESLILAARTIVGD